MDYQVHKDFITKKEAQEPTSNLYIFALAVAFLLFTLGVIALNYQSKQLKEQDTTITQEVIKNVAVMPTESEIVYYNIPLEEEWQDLVFDLSERYNVPCEIVFGVMWRESTFNLNAVNDDCIGIMQIKEKYIADLACIGVTDLHNPVQNIEAGIYILSQKYERYGDWHKALVHYHNGDNAKQDVLSEPYTHDVINYSMRLECKK